MKTALIFVCLLCGALAAFAQTDAQRKIDSLQNVIETTDSDTTKARSLCRLCWELKSIGELDNAIENGKAGLELSRKFDDKDSESTCLNNIGACMLVKGQYDETLDYYNKSLAIKQEIGHKEGIARTHLNIGIVYDYKGS